MFINKVLIYGNLTRDPELRQTNNGTAVAALGIATNRVYKNQSGEKVEEVEFHSITLFGKQAELACQYLKKGGSIFIEGRLRTSTWEQDGQKKYKTEIVGENMQFGPKTSHQSTNTNEVSNTTSKKPEVDVVDMDPNDIPF